MSSEEAVKRKPQIAKISKRRLYRDRTRFEVAARAECLGIDEAR